MNKDLLKNILARSVEIALGICLSATVLTFFLYIIRTNWQPKLEALTRPIIRNQVSVQITSKEKKLLDALAEKGAISTPQEVLSQVISFYDTQNAFLLGIMALSGLFGFFYIRQKTRNETEGMLKTQFETFTKTIDFQTKINSTVENSDTIIELKQTADDLYKKINSLNAMEEKADDRIASDTSSKQTLTKVDPENQGEK